MEIRSSSSSSNVIFAAARAMTKQTRTPVTYLMVIGGTLYRLFDYEASGEGDFPWSDLCYPVVCSRVEGDFPIIFYFDNI